MGRGLTTGLLGGAELAGAELVGLAVGEADGVGEGVPPQALNTTIRRQTEIASSLLPRPRAVFFTAILLTIYIFKNSRWNFKLVL